MRFSQVTWWAALALAAVACKPPVRITPPPADAPAAEVAVSGASILIGAGDIAACNSRGDEDTAALVDSVLKADSVAKVDDVVASFGDNAYPDGSARDFAFCFGPSWGDSAKRILKKMRPSPGNHEHSTDGATPYYDYFGKNAGSPKKGYYSYSLGEWHVVVLNSEIVVNGAFPLEERQAQETWLIEDLKGTTKKCIVAYWHHPRYSSGWHGGDVRIGSLWRILYEHGADIVLNGHDHHYERFRPMNADGMVDTTKGVVEFVAGTGGGGLRGLRNTLAPNSAYQLQGHFGVVKLTLGAGEWRSAFLDTQGRTWDPSGGSCH